MDGLRASVLRKSLDHWYIVCCKYQEGRVITGPNGEKRPADVLANALHVAKIATGEIEETYVFSFGLRHPPNWGRFSGLQWMGTVAFVVLGIIISVVGLS